MKNLLVCSGAEFCPSCKSVQPVRNSRYEHGEKGAAERTKTVVTMIFHCGSCGSFVRSEEQELVEAREMAVQLFPRVHNN